MSLKRKTRSWFGGAAGVALTVAIVAFLAFCRKGFCVSSPRSDTRAIRANDFLNSLGAVTHIIQGIDSASDVVAGIRYLGIRNIRDDGTNNMRFLNALCSMHLSTGVMIDELPISGDLTATRSEWDRLAACGGLVAAEGPNEPNNFSFIYKNRRCSSNNGGGTFLPCAEFQRDLYAMVHNDSKLAGIPVWGMTEVGAEPDNVGLQWLEIPPGADALMPGGTRYADVANAHNYVQGNASSRHTLEDNQAFWAESVDRGGACGGCFDVYGEYWGGAGGRGQGTWAKGYPINVLGQNEIPKVTTETGWNVKDTPSVSADMQGRLLTDVYLQAFRQGWSKTFIYLMFNGGKGDQGYGMLNAPGRPTLLGQYIHNLTSILSDTSSRFTPGRVNYSIRGMPATGYALLFEKSNGKYDLAVWGEAFASETPSTITVNLGDTYAVKIYDVTRGIAPVQTPGSVSSVRLTLTDHAMIVEF